MVTVVLAAICVVGLVAATVGLGADDVKIVQQRSDGGTDVRPAQTSPGDATGGRAS